MGFYSSQSHFGVILWDSGVFYGIPGFPNAILGSFCGILWFPVPFWGHFMGFGGILWDSRVPKRHFGVILWDFGGSQCHFGVTLGDLGVFFGIPGFPVAFWGRFVGF